MLNFLSQEAVGPGMYCIPHIVFLAIMIPLFILGTFLVIKFVNSEKRIRLTILITAGVLLALVITNRIGYTYQRVVEFNGVMIIDGEEIHYNWGYLLPETLCSMTALFLSLAVLCFKKDNILLHSLVYLGLINGLISSFYPNYLNVQGFFEVGTMTSLIFHFVMAFLCLIILLKKYMTPTIKKWYVTPITYAFFVLLALFEIQVLDTPANDAMSIFYPLTNSLPHLSKWYCIGPGLTLGVIVVLFLYEHFKNKKNFKAILREMFFIKNKATKEITNKKKK